MSKLLFNGNLVHHINHLGQLLVLVLRGKTNRPGECIGFHSVTVGGQNLVLHILLERLILWVGVRFFDGSNKGVELCLVRIIFRESEDLFTVGLRRSL